MSELDSASYLPLDPHGADLLFQVISARGERGFIVLATNNGSKQWPSIFNGDSTITAFTATLTRSMFG